MINNKGCKQMIKQVQKIIKDNEDDLIYRGLAGDVEDIDFELKYNHFTKRNIIVFFDNDTLNGCGRSIISYIADKMNKNSNRIYRWHTDPAFTR